MKDPYKILGVSPDATDDEVKTAYRNLARKYHPDKYRDSDLAEMAGEKMKEINAAYDEVQKIRSGKATGSGGSAYDAGSSYGGSSYGGYNGAGYGSSNPFITARQLINLRRINEAAQVLASVPEADRGAEWHFLMGCIAINRGHYVDAQQFFDTACAMDPTNAEYRNAQDRLRNSAGQFGTGMSSSSSNCTFCDICTAFMCADCCCDFGRICC